MEIEGITYSGIGSLDLMDMEAALKQAPWFSYLREILLEKLYRKDKEAFAETFLAAPYSCLLARRFTTGLILLLRKRLLWKLNLFLKKSRRLFHKRFTALE